MRVALLTTALALAACAADPMPEIRRAYDRGDYLWAHDRLTELESGGDAHVYALERAMTELALGRPADGEQALRFARSRLDELGGQSALAWLSAVLLDDRQLAYPGADYEHVLVRAMLALADLMDDDSDTTSYALQVLQRQVEIIEAYDHEGTKPKQGYKLVAFGSYLRGILNEDEPLNVGVAASAFEKALELEPGSQLAREGLERARNGRHSEAGNGVVHVICLVGRGPFRVEVDETATRAALAIAQVIWAQIRNRATFPNIAEVKIPELAFHRDNPTEVMVDAAGQELATEVITDVEETARAEFEAMRQHIVARAVLRRAAKIVVTEGVKEVFNPRDDRDKHRRGRQRKSADPLFDFAVSLGGLVWTALEHADLRCWSLLPASFQAARLELPAGDHDIVLRPAMRGAPVGRPQTVRVNVRDGRNSYVVALLPTQAGGPPPMTSDPASTNADATSPRTNP